MSSQFIPIQTEPTKKRTEEEVQNTSLQSLVDSIKRTSREQEEEQDEHDK